MPDKLSYKSSKLHPLILKKIEKDVDRGVYVSFNTALNEILMQHYEIEFAKKIRLSDLTIGERFVFDRNQVSDEKTWVPIKGCRDNKRLCRSDSDEKEEYKDCNSVVYKA